MEGVRLDKYLWAIRVFKTRSEATDACNGNKVRLNGNPAKASKEVKPGDMLEVRKGPIVLSYKVLATSGSRMGAALVPQYAEDHSASPGPWQRQTHQEGEEAVGRTDGHIGRRLLIKLERKCVEL